MLPAWISKLKDLKANQKQTKSPFLLPSSSESKRADKKLPTYFAKALSLQKANNRARSARLEAEIGYLTGGKDSESIFSSSDNDTDTCMLSSIHMSTDACMYSTTHTCTHSSTDTCIYSSISSPMHSSTSAYLHTAKHTRMHSPIHTSPHICMLSSTGAAAASRKLHNHGNAEPFNTAEEAALRTINCSDLEHSFDATASCGIKQLYKGKRRLVPCGQNEQYAVIDNDTEDSNALTPDTIESSFGSETSSADSSMIHKSGYAEEDRRLKGAYSMDREAMSRPTFLEGSLTSRKLQERSSLDVAEHHCLSNFDTCREHVFHATRSSDSVSGVCCESNPSFVKGSSLLFTPREERNNFDFGNVSSTESFSQQKSYGSYGIAENCSIEECQASPVKDLRVAPSILQEGSSLEGTQLCSFSYSEWEERSVLIAVENPGLMRSSKWQQERSNSCSLQAQGLENIACVDRNLDLAMCKRQDNTNGFLRMCDSQSSSTAANHKSKQNAYLRKGRRHSASSFSAALPEDLQGVVGDSVALVKMSYNPYDDFRQSMYEMIMEKDLEESMDVEELLYCYLSLNPPELHELIEEVFSDVWSLILMSVR
eukprot:c22664_g1_i1 orf=623-2413(+)